MDRLAEHQDRLRRRVSAAAADIGALVELLENELYVDQRWVKSSKPLFHQALAALKRAIPEVEQW